MSLKTLLNTWRDTPNIVDNITAWRTFPAQTAQTVPLPSDLHPTLAKALQQTGIEALYTHQATTWQQVWAGHHPVIVTSTASGKTLCYNLPTLHQLLIAEQTRALYLFPTKALAYDQLTTLNNLLAAKQQSFSKSATFNLAKNKLPLPIATYDGDTPTATRPAIRSQARLILSNPDMLHTAILPHHTKWAGFLQQLRFVVIDEMHIYRGVFGSHVGNVLRRLKRVAHFYGATLQFILTSATIANPTELAERLIEEPVTLIDHDGAAKGAKHFLIYNPPLIKPDLGVRRSALQESIRLSRELLEHQVQTIIFGRARRTVEMTLNYLREQVSQTPGLKKEGFALDSTLSYADNIQTHPRSPAPIIRAYRSGYLPRQRREIEQGLRDGQVQAVVATSALELGIDIGGMGAAVLVGYPGSIAGTWQQAGRAGRQNEAALAILIASANPLDQFLSQHPDYFFGRSPEQALVNPDNLLILLQHIRCAAFELPFQRGDSFGGVKAEEVTEFLQFIQESGDLHQSGTKYFWMADQYPANGVSLRSASPQTIRLEVTDEADAPQRTIGQVDLASAPWMVHPQAIYLHEGQSFLVDRLDLENYVAHLYPVKVDYYTEPKRETTVELIEQSEQATVAGGSKNHGEIVVTTQVVGYRLLRWYTQERLGEGEVDLPPDTLHTTGYWLTLAPETVDYLRALGLWSNDPNDYGPNWQKQRNQTRARDGYRCHICGTAEQGREHDVHHKIPFRRFTSYKEANHINNLVTLCRSCHQRAETAVRMRSGLAGLATTLGHLAPLFLMCDQHDIGLHADPQSSLAYGQPAVIIYDMVPAGIGFSQRLFALHDELVFRARELVTACYCADGCPSCVGPAGEDGQGGKQETLGLLKALTL